MSVAFAQRFFRMIAGRRYLPYSDFTGTTNATANTQTLFNHGLVDEKGAPVAPSRVVVTANGATPAGFPYEVAASHTTTQCDIRATGISVPFRARAFV
jgi:hypothetical protein